MGNDTYGHINSLRNLAKRSSDKYCRRNTGCWWIYYFFALIMYL